MNLARHHFEIHTVQGAHTGKGLDDALQAQGGIGGLGFTPIVNPPELAILGITRTETVTVWDGDRPRPVPMVPLNLSYDHQVINGADAARYMAKLRTGIETRATVMI
ncbi:MAG: 2-oxo acid dehydrogenase subunit E2 [Roseinatronobacter sp.]